MKQIGLGFAQYTQDYDEKFPNGNARTGGGWNPGFAGQGWAGQTYPYIKSGQIFTCPSDTNAGSGTPGTSVVSYAYNAYVASGDNSGRLQTNSRSLSSVSESARTIMLQEVSGKPGNAGVFVSDPLEIGGNASSPTDDGGTNLIWKDSGGSTNCCNGSTYKYRTGGVFPDATGTAAQQDTVGVHFDGGNYLFVDGHVKWLRPSALRSVNTALSACQTAGCFQVE